MEQVTLSGVEHVYNFCLVNELLIIRSYKSVEFFMMFVILRIFLTFHQSVAERIRFENSQD